MLYDIAGLKIQINNRLSYTNGFCEKYLSADQSAVPDITVAVTDEEFYKEKKGSENFADGYIENLCI